MAARVRGLLSSLLPVVKLDVVQSLAVLVDPTHSGDSSEVVAPVVEAHRHARASGEPRFGPCRRLALGASRRRLAMIGRRAGTLALAAAALLPLGCTAPVTFGTAAVLALGTLLAAAAAAASTAAALPLALAAAAWP